MEYNMIENSMDSLSESVEYYKNGKKHNNERSFKFCILLLSHSAELLLKQILLEQHEILIFENIDDVKSGKENTVGFKMALSRINKICKNDLNRYHTYLYELSDIRNDIQHYQFSISAERCTKIITSSFSAIEYIVTHVLNKTFDDFNDVITAEQIQYLHEDKEVYDKRKQDIAKDISDNKWIKVGIEYQEKKFIYTPCPNCSEETLVMEDSNVICKFCGKRFGSTSDLYENDYNCVIATHMEREIGRRRTTFRNIYECDVCNNDTLIYGTLLDEWVCLVCGNRFSSTLCDHCGDEIPYSEYHYTFAQSYTDTDDFKYLCKECGAEFQDSEYSVEYNIR